MDIFYFILLSVRQEINQPPPPDSPPSPPYHPPKGIYPHRPTPCPSPQLPEGRPPKCSPMAGEGRGQYRRWCTIASKPHCPFQPGHMHLPWSGGRLPSVPISRPDSCS